MDMILHKLSLTKYHSHINKLINFGNISLRMPDSDFTRLLVKFAEFFI